MKSWPTSSTLLRRRLRRSCPSMPGRLTSVRLLWVPFQSFPTSMQPCGFFSSVAFNFYGIFAVCMTFAFAMGWLPWVGSKMAAAQKRAAETGALDAAGAEPMMPPNGPENQAEGYEPSLLDFFVPIGVLLGIGVLPTVLFDANWIDEAFVCCALSAMVVARARGLSLGDVMDGFINGCKAMTIGAVILGLAVTLALVTSGEYCGLLGLAHERYRARRGAACDSDALVHGYRLRVRQQWGTYAVVFPVAMPLAWALAPDPVFIQALLRRSTRGIGIR